MQSRLLASFSVLFFASLVACGGDDSNSTNPGTGGTAGSAGAGGSAGSAGSGGSSGAGGTAGTGGSAGSGGTAGGGGTAGAGGTAGSNALCTAPTTVECSDQVILKLNLQVDVAPGLISNTADGAGWTSKIDATAGGSFVPTPDSYVYGKFSDQGLEKVSVGDQDALDSMDWDIAFRRYVVRINSADSGPSCVQAAHVAGATLYEDVVTTPDGLTYKTDDTFTAACEVIADNSGLPDSPATALSTYWTYANCVQMTGNVFVIALADGRHVKLVVDDYYSPTVQTQCDSTGSIPMSNTGSANFIVRWAFLP